MGATPNRRASSGCSSNCPGASVWSRPSRASGRSGSPSETGSSSAGPTERSTRHRPSRAGTLAPTCSCPPGEAPPTCCPSGVRSGCAPSGDVTDVAFLGSAGAIASRSRDTTSLVVVASEGAVLVDGGGSPVQKLRRARVDPLALAYAIVTPLHADPAYGLPALVQTVI